MDKIILVPKNEFLIDGTALLNLWGGPQGTIEMTPYAVEAKSLEELKEKILAGANDGGFGCESIQSLIESRIFIYYDFANKTKDEDRYLGVPVKKLLTIFNVGDFRSGNIELEEDISDVFQEEKNDILDANYLLKGSSELEILIKKEGDYIYGFTWDTAHRHEEDEGSFRGEWTRRNIEEDDLISGSFLDTILPDMEHYCMDFKDNMSAVLHIVRENVKQQVEESDVIERTHKEKLTVKEAHELLKDKEDGEFIIFSLNTESK